ncbi:MAG: hypothetical protein R3D03_01655 [Geminicoccaceae bacterium]
MPAIAEQCRRAFGAALTTGQTVDDVEAWPDRISAVSRISTTPRSPVFDIRRSVTAKLLPEETEPTG